MAHQSPNTYSNFIKLDLTTTIQHAHSPELTMYKPPPRNANFRIPHFTHRSMPSFHSFHYAFRSSAFYQRPCKTDNHHRSGARFTKYLTTVLRLSYDNAIVTIDLRRTTNLPNRLTKGARLFLGMIHLQDYKIV